MAATRFALTCQLNQYLTYVPVLNGIAPFTCSINPSITTSPFTNTTFSTITGTIIVNKPYLLTSLTTFFVTVTDSLMATYVYSFTFQVIAALDNAVYLNTNTTVSFTPNYNLKPPTDGSYDYSYNLVTNDNTNGLYPATYSTALPVGLSYNQSTGVFSGALTFFSQWPLTNYQMRLRNVTQGTSYSYFQISVDNKPLFAYPDSPYTFAPGPNIITITPVIYVNAIAIIYSVAPSSPGLPNNLTINRSTGVISGILDALSVGQNTYTIVAQTASGSPSGNATATLTINVNVLSDYIYPSSPYILKQGVYTKIVPKSLVGSVNSYGSVKVIDWIVGANFPPNVAIKSFYANLQPYTNVVKAGNYLVMFGNYNCQDTFLFNLTTYTWTTLTCTNPALNPSIRYNACMTYCPDTTSVLLYGGITGTVFATTILKDTWLFNMATFTWRQVSSSNVIVGKRANASLTYDPINKVAILFGGVTNFTFGTYTMASNDAAIYNFTTNLWSVTAFVSKPSERMLASFTNVYSNNIYANVLFGGKNDIGFVYNDTWIFDVVTGWTQLTFTNPFPSSRYGASMVYCKSNNTTYLYGGLDFLGASYFNDLWTFTNIGVWNWNKVTDTFTLTNSYISLPMVSAGDIANANIGLLLRNDGMYNINGFTVLPAINPPQDLKFGAFDGANNAFIYAYNEFDQEFMFCHVTINSTVPFVNTMETWLFNLSAQTWTKQITISNPPLVYGGGLVYDTVSNTYILFAGYDRIYPTTNVIKVYYFINGDWQAITTVGSFNPISRAGFSVAYDPSTKKVLLFGGFQYTGFSGSPFINFNETWVFDTIALTWSLLQPTFNLSPSARSQASLVYYTQANQFVMFAGLYFDTTSNDFLDLNDTWSFTLVSKTWTNLTNESTLPQMFNAQMVYDSSNNRIIMWGGQSLELDSLQYQYTWQFVLANNGDTNNWRLVPTNTVLTTNVNVSYLGCLFAYNIAQDKFYLIQAFPLTNVNTIIIPAPDPPNITPYGITFTPCPQPQKYTSMPTIPYGLTLDETTGIISGTPTVIQPMREYFITETNAIGTFITSLIISVVRPYTGGREESTPCYSSADQMRHKATILQYNGNQNQLTKKQQWAQIAKNVGKFARRTWSTQTVNYTNPNTLQLPLQGGNTLLCASNPTIYTPTSSSDVPGPIINLRFNPNEPLLNFVSRLKKTSNGSKYPEKGPN